MRSRRRYQRIAETGELRAVVPGFPVSAEAESIPPRCRRSAALRRRCGSSTRRRGRRGRRAPGRARSRARQRRRARAFNTSFLWADEVARLALAILAFIGGAVAYRRRDHAFVRVVLNALPRSVRSACLALADVLVLFVAGLTGIASIDFLASSWSERTPILQLPAAMIALPLPIGMALLVVYAVAHLLA